MKIFNTLTKKIEDLEPLNPPNVNIYSCGPTVYDHAHIGNLRGFIFSDLLRRVISFNGFNVIHAMNYTDVDDKTIKRAKREFPDLEPYKALRKLTDKYIDFFLKDMRSVGNDTGALTFLRATDPTVINGMQSLIKRLLDNGFAYIAEDGVYFSIDAYRKSGKKYGQLLELSLENTSASRIQNDEYDKESAHDFALWKKQQPGEPSWDFNIDGQVLAGRPGWHIECSAMSRQLLGQPFDIHTGGVDLIFPHHENEIAQSTACESDSVMARFFTHNEHLLVNGKKMAKSANNFFTIQDIIYKGFDPLSFRLLVLQAHYRSQAHFSWDSIKAAQIRLNELRALAALKWQPNPNITERTPFEIRNVATTMSDILSNDLDSPKLFAFLSEVSSQLLTIGLNLEFHNEFVKMLNHIDDLLGLKLNEVPDINTEQKKIIALREKTRKDKEWKKSDEFRKLLEEQGVGLRDMPYGTIWNWL